jgi:phenylpropionate dioxygenase-like ring-hydroxylating dioxygenase large terminal subunit
MEHGDQVRLLKVLMDHLDKGTNVDAGGQRRNPASAYTCPDLAQREWETFFRGHAQLIGLTGDLPKPGSFVTSSDFGVPVLAVRDEEGEFRAFLNVCRHRGAVVESEPRGSRSRFSCPFHAWTYSNRGELVSVPKPEHFGHVDKACHGLIVLPAVEKYGFLWVHPDPEGSIDRDALLGGLAPEFESWEFGRLAHTGVDTYDMRLNWKLAMDTFGETYHFPVLHRTLIEDSPERAAERFQIFGDIIRDEDYAVAATAQRGAESGLLDHVLFGRNEPALHHYHNTYREALGMQPLELLDG